MRDEAAACGAMDRMHFEAQCEGVGRKVKSERGSGREKLLE